jgi:hypothetical protein
MNNIDNLPIPPIIKQYVENMLSDSVQIHARENYRDILDKVRIVCEESIKKFEKKMETSRHSNNRKK